MNKLRLYSVHHLAWPSYSQDDSIVYFFHLLKITWSKLYQVVPVYIVIRHDSGEQYTKIHVNIIRLVSLILNITNEFKQLVLVAAIRCLHLHGIPFFCLVSIILYSTKYSTPMVYRVYVTNST